MPELPATTCPTCGAPITAGQRFCGRCGRPRGAEGAASVEEIGAAGLAWEADISLLTNPLMLRQWGILLGVSGLIMCGLLSLLFAVNGDWEQIPMALMATLVGLGIVALLLLVVVVLIFGNRYRARFAVGEKGASMETVDRRARTANRLAVLMGVLGRSPTATGAGLLAASRERETYSWRGIVAASYHPRGHTIILRNEWRAVAFLACTPANYEPVAAYVRRHLSARASGSAAPRRSPLPRLLLRTVLVIVAALPVFLLPYPFEQDALLPLLMLCFALATIWLVHLFGWVVIGAALLVAARIAVTALSMRESAFAWRAPYRTYELLDDGDWVALALAAAGLAVLIAFSWRAARGRIPAALVQDQAELDDDESPS